MTQKSETVDWVHVPSHAELKSLWVSLHDGEIVAVRSDTLERTVVLEIDIAHLRTYYKLGEDCRFQITLQGVESVRATTFVNWPGPMPDVKGKSREEQNDAIASYQAKGRQESIEWKEIESAFPANILDIYDADLASGDHSKSIYLQGFLDGDDVDRSYVKIFIRCEEMLIRQSDSVALTLEQFLQMGGDYWSALK